MGLLTTFRSALVQADFNERMFNIVVKELTIASVVGACLFWWLWGWQWLFWGLLIFPTFFSFGFCFKFTRNFILGLLGAFWALPFAILGIVGIHAAWVGVPIAFLMCQWVHFKALTWGEDLGRTDNDNTVW